MVITEKLLSNRALQGVLYDQQRWDDFFLGENIIELMILRQIKKDK